MKKIEDFKINLKLSQKLDWTLLYAKYAQYISSKVSNVKDFKSFFSIFIITLNEEKRLKNDYEHVLNFTISSFNFNKDWREFSGNPNGYHYEYDRELFMETYSNFEIYSNFEDNNLFESLEKDLKIEKNKDKNKYIKCNMPGPSAFTPTSATDCIFKSNDRYL